MFKIANPAPYTAKEPLRLQSMTTQLTKLTPSIMYKAAEVPETIFFLKVYT